MQICMHVCKTTTTKVSWYTLMCTYVCVAYVSQEKLPSHMVSDKTRNGTV